MKLLSTCAYVRTEHEVDNELFLKVQTCHGKVIDVKIFVTILKFQRETLCGRKTIITNDQRSMRSKKEETYAVRAANLKITREISQKRLNLSNALNMVSYDISRSIYLKENKFSPFRKLFHVQYACA